MAEPEAVGQVRIVEAHCQCADGAVCRVCGDAITDHPHIFCPDCGAAHHRDCWEYNAGCSIYGCGCTEALPRARSRWTRVDTPRLAPKPVKDGQGISTRAHWVRLGGIRQAEEGRNWVRRWIGNPILGGAVACIALLAVVFLWEVPIPKQAWVGLVCCLSGLADQA